MIRGRHNSFCFLRPKWHRATQIIGGGSLGSTLILSGIICIALAGRLRWRRVNDQLYFTSCRHPDIPLFFLCVKRFLLQFFLVADKLGANIERTKGNRRSNGVFLVGGSFCGGSHTRPSVGRYCRHHRRFSSREEFW